MGKRHISAHIDPSLRSNVTVLFPAHGRAKHRTRKRVRRLDNWRDIFLYSETRPAKWIGYVAGWAIVGYIAETLIN